MPHSPDTTTHADQHVTFAAYDLIELSTEAAILLGILGMAKIASQLAEAATALDHAVGQDAEPGQHDLVS